MPPQSDHESYHKGYPSGSHTTDSLRRLPVDILKSELARRKKEDAQVTEEALEQRANFVRAEWPWRLFALVVCTLPLALYLLVAKFASHMVDVQQSWVSVLVLLPTMVLVILFLIKDVRINAKFRTRFPNLADAIDRPTDEEEDW